MILQLNPPIPMTHIEKGDCLAHFMHDDGIESSILFTVFMDDTGEIWTFNNRVLRAQKNITAGRCFKENNKNGGYFQINGTIEELYICPNEMIIKCSNPNKEYKIIGHSEIKYPFEIFHKLQN